MEIEFPYKPGFFLQTRFFSIWWRAKLISCQSSHTPVQIKQLREGGLPRLKLVPELSVLAKSNAEKAVRAAERALNLPIRTCVADAHFMCFTRSSVQRAPPPTTTCHLRRARWWWWWWCVCVKQDVLSALSQVMRRRKIAPRSSLSWLNEARKKTSPHTTPQIQVDGGTSFFNTPLSDRTKVHNNLN